MGFGWRLRRSFQTDIARKGLDTNASSYFKTMPMGTAIGTSRGRGPIGTPCCSAGRSSSLDSGGLGINWTVVAWGLGSTGDLRSSPGPGSRAPCTFINSTTAAVDSS